jgi:DNA-binding MarR family transcriptional regulator
VFLLDKIADQILQKRMNLGFSQFLVMMTLADQPHAPQKFIAAALDQTQAAVSRQIELLVRKGLVVRARKLDNKREYILSLTKLGEKTYNICSLEVNAKFEKLFQIWSKHEKNIVLGALDKLIFELRGKGQVPKKT